MECGTWGKLTETPQLLIVIKRQVIITIALMNLGMLSPFSFTVHLLYSGSTVGFSVCFLILSQYLVLRLTLVKNSEGPRLGIMEYLVFIPRKKDVESFKPVWAGLWPLSHWSMNSSSSSQTNTFEYLALNPLEATAAISAANSPARPLDNSKLKLSGFPIAQAETKLSGRCAGGRLI